MLKDLINKLKNNPNFKLLGGVHDYQSGGDIDFLIKNINEVEILSIFSESRFLIYCHPRRGYVVCFFEKKKLYFFDLAEYQDLLLDFFPSVKFSNVFLSEIWNDPLLEKFMRYTLQLRGKKSKFKNYVHEHFNKYGHFLSNFTYLSSPIFKNKVSPEEVIKTMERNLISTFLSLRLSKVIELYCRKTYLFFRNIGKGEIVAFVGADGAGKSTAIESVWKVMGADKVYMGDVNFRLHKTHKFLFKQPIFIARLSYLLMYIENWFRYAWIWSRKIKGDIVYTDRWPGLNQHLRSDEGKMKVHDWLYAFFPNPDRYVFLSADALSIHTRKPELTVSEIEILQKNLRKRLKGKKYLEVISEDLDCTLTKVLAYLMEIKWRKIN